MPVALMRWRMSPLSTLAVRHLGASSLDRVIPITPPATTTAATPVHIQVLRFM